MNKYIPLVPGKKYVFIDALYVDDFKNIDPSILLNTNLVELRKIVFPYTGDPYSLIESDISKFDLSRIKYFPDPEAEGDELNQFCSDTGVILIVEDEVFLSVIQDFDSNVSDALEDHIEKPTTSNKWTELTDKYRDKLFYFSTVEIDEDYAGGGNFQID
jgi:hypothetical protein